MNQRIRWCSALALALCLSTTAWAISVPVKATPSARQGTCPAGCCADCPADCPGCPCCTGAKTQAKADVDSECSGCCCSSSSDTDQATVRVLKKLAGTGKTQAQKAGSCTGCPYCEGAAHKAAKP